MDLAELTHSLAQLLSDVTSRTLDPEVDSDTPLRDLGLSSLRMIQLIGDLESTFRLRVEDDDLDEDNFGTFSGLLAFVASRTP